MRRPEQPRSPGFAQRLTDEVALELSEGREDVVDEAGEHGAAAVVAARDCRQLARRVVEEIAPHHPVAQTPGQPVETVDHDVVDLACTDHLDQTPERRPIERAAADPDVIESLGQADPPLVLHRADEDLAQLTLDLAGREVGLAGHRLPRADRAAGERTFGDRARHPRPRSLSSDLRSASFFIVSSSSSVMRAAACLSRADLLLCCGRMISASPPVFTSSGVSLSMPSSSRMGFSMMSPRLLPIAVSFLITRHLRLTIVMTEMRSQPQSWRRSRRSNGPRFATADHLFDRRCEPVTRRPTESGDTVTARCSAGFCQPGAGSSRE